MKLVRLKDVLNDYHKRRAEKHGYIYYAVRKFGARPISQPGSEDWLVEAKSLATGATVTLYSDFVEEQADG